MPEHTGKFVSYLRVSTQEQGRSGLGIEAQRAAIESYLNGGNWRLVEEVVEVESGRNSERPELAKAFAMCRAHRATLVIAKLDRLSRNTVFLLQLCEAGIDFVAVDMPSANRMTIGIMAVMAEEEARAISARTKAALDSIKRVIAETGSYTARSGRTITKLGNGGISAHVWTEEERARGSAAGRAARKRLADQRAADLLPVIERIQAEGTTSASGIARRLNDEGVPTPRGGGSWQAVQVQRILTRAGSTACEG